MQILFGKAEPQQCGARERTERRRAAAVQRFQNNSLPRDQTVAIGIRGLQFFQDPRFLVFEIEERPERFERECIQIDVFGKRGDLFDIGDARALMQSDRSGVVRFFADQHLHQRGLSGSVHADQTDALSGSDLKRYVRKQRSVCERFLQVFCIQYNHTAFSIAQFSKFGNNSKKFQDYDACVML